MSEKAIARDCGDKSLHPAHMYWLPKEGTAFGETPHAWAGYERGSCPGVTEESRLAEATLPAMEVKAEEIRAFLGVKPAPLQVSAEGAKTAPASDYSWGAATEKQAAMLKATQWEALQAMARAVAHASETAHVTNVIVRPVPNNRNAYAWRCDFCLAGDE